MSETIPPTSNLTLTCHCRAITITIPRPTEPLNECLCSICHRYGALWAYYHTDSVQIITSSTTDTEASNDVTDIYICHEKTIEFHRCKTCGCVTYWVPRDRERKKIGVNCRLLERKVLDGLERRFDEGPE